LVEHRTFNAVVAGSSPARPTIHSVGVRGFRAPFLILLLCGPTLLRPQTNSAPARTIKIKPGGPAITLEADVEKGREVFFAFHATAGLKFTGHLAAKSGKAGFAVDDPAGKGLLEEEFDFNTDLTGSLEKTGDYKISVATFDSNRVHFTLIVRVY
jgi:hypothetical protein